MAARLMPKSAADVGFNALNMSATERSPHNTPPYTNNTPLPAGVGQGSLDAGRGSSCPCSV